MASEPCSAIIQMDLSARTRHRVPKLARTIAERPHADLPDLTGEDNILSQHLAEAGRTTNVFPCVEFDDLTANGYPSEKNPLPTQQSRHIPSPNRRSSCQQTSTLLWAVPFSETSPPNPSG